MQSACKCIVVGDRAAAKTELCRAMISQQQQDHGYIPTVFDNYEIAVTVDGNPSVSVGLWDTTGQEDYPRLRLLTYPQTNVILLCFSLENLTSFSNVKENWYPELCSQCPGAPIILVGTSSRGAPLVTRARAELLAQEIQAVKYMKSTEADAILAEVARSFISTKSCAEPSDTVTPFSTSKWLMQIGLEEYDYQFTREKLTTPQQLKQLTFPILRTELRMKLGDIYDCLAAVATL